MLRNLVGLVTGYERDPELARQAEDFRAQIQAATEAHEAATAHYPPIPEWGRDFPDSSNPYDGWPVPEGALLEPEAEFLDDFDETWNVAPANNGTDVVVFHQDFRAETHRDEAIFEEDYRRDVEGREPNAWLANIVAIHKRLDEEGHPHNRIVRFRGSTCSSYRLEHPRSGIFNFIPSEEKHDAVLALHQRWALQYLSACRHIHAKGIALNGPPVSQTLWLRSDFSLVVAAFTGASCAALGIDFAYWAYGGRLDSPFDPENVRRGTNEQEDGGGGGVGDLQVKADLFQWACWVYGLMTGCESPVVDPEMEWMWDGPEGDRLREEKWADEEAVREGRFERWPVLRDEELGDCLVKAWRGEYGSAGESMGDVRGVLERCGRVLVDGEEDEVGGFEWEKVFGYDESSGQISRVVDEKGACMLA